MNDRFLLDRNIIIAIFAQVAEVLQKLGQAGEVFLPTVVLGELYYGARRSERAEANILRIDQLASRSAVLFCEAETARFYGEVKDGLRRKGRPIPENDVWIAALAIQHNLTLVSRDAHFRQVDNLAVVTW